jgi:large subunit ribosomal protein L35
VGPRPAALALVVPLRPLRPPDGHRRLQPAINAIAHAERVDRRYRRLRTGAPVPICFNSGPMPKMKTHSGAKKRFRVTAGGKLRARHAMTSHNLGKKAAKRKRRLGRPVEVKPANAHEVKRLLAGGGGAK